MKHLIGTIWGFGMLVICSAHAQANSTVADNAGAVAGQKVLIDINQSGFFVTDLQFSLSKIVTDTLTEEVTKKCSPLKTATNIDVHVKLDRWVDGTDTQSLVIQGTAVCSQI